MLCLKQLFQMNKLLQITPATTNNLVSIVHLLHSTRGGQNTSIGHLLHSTHGGENSSIAQRLVTLKVSNYEQ